MDNDDTTINTRVEPTSLALREQNEYGRVPITPMSSCCHSLTYDIKFDINPLVQAASSILTLFNKLRTADHYEDLDDLQRKIIMEVERFEIIAQQNQYWVDTVLVARYILCVAFDDLISFKSWGKKWANYSLLMHFQNEDNGDDRVLFILERIKEEPKTHIDLIELMYLLLNFGYEGNFRHKINGKGKLNTLVDELYQLIRQVRGNVRRKLMSEEKNESPIIITKKSLRPLAKWIGITLMIGAVAFCSAQTILSLSSAHLQNQLTQLLKDNP